MVNYWILLKATLQSPNLLDGLSLKVIHSSPLEASSRKVKIFGVGCLAFNFLNSIDVFLISFSHVHRIGNYLAHLLAKDALVFDDLKEWTSNILPHVSHPISFDIKQYMIHFPLKK